jgi:hypothetical protein
MGKKKSKKEKIYKSVIEFQQKFFPRSFEEKVTHPPKEDEEPLGTGVALDLFKGTRKTRTARK